jgi:hypothetical protein
MTYFQAVVIALIQGVTELFPVSSLGHSVLLPAWFGGSWQALVTPTGPAGEVYRVRATGPPGSSWFVPHNRGTCFRGQARPDGTVPIMVTLRHKRECLPGEVDIFGVYGGQVLGGEVKTRAPNSPGPNLTMTS